MVEKFSANARDKILTQMAAEELDLLVVGGGITGAGIALDAANRGLRVGVLEQADFGSGTSSRSTKLIHGGLRYLKQGEVKLVREVGRERAILFKNAPHLVIPAPMLLPIYKKGTFGYYATSIGLYIYDVLAGVVKNEKRRMLRAKAAIQQEPLLKTDGLKGAGCYYEYRTDDARLTLDIMKTAASLGAQCVNYAQVTEFIYQDGRAVGVVAEDRVSGETYRIGAKNIVNAAGPWVDQIRSLDGSLHGKRLFLTKGVHLVVDYHRLPVRQSAYFDTPDGRMIFVIPRDGITYIGTTDTEYNEEIDDPRTTEADMAYLLTAVNAMFPGVQLVRGDVKSHWAGLRPLIYEEGKSPSELSRKDEMFLSDTGLITIAGGKLTGYRKMAEKVVDLVVKRLQRPEGKSFPGCTTDRIVVSGGELLGHSTFEECKQALLQRGVERGIPAPAVREWIQLYGANAQRIFAYFELMANEPEWTPEELALRAQIAYSVEEEMTVTAVDFLRLRTGWLFFDVQRAQRELERVLTCMAEIRHWDEAEYRQQREAVAKELAHLIRGLQS